MKIGHLNPLYKQNETKKAKTVTKTQHIIIESDVKTPLTKFNTSL